MPNGLQSRGALRRQNGTLFRRHRHAKVCGGLPINAALGQVRVSVINSL